MFSRCLSLGLMCALPFVAATQSTLRVCADPNNLPFSNQQGQGFENKLAELVAAKLDAKLEYTWWAQRKSFVKHSLDQGACDVIMGVPSSDPELLATKPYYRSTYVFLSRHDRNLHITSLADARLTELRIGIHVVGDDYAPPAYALARRGITRNIIGFSLFGEYAEPNPPRRLVAAVDKGEVDLAIVWGPFAGYFGQIAKAQLDIAPVTPATFFGVPFVYDIAAGVQKGNEALKVQLDQILESESAPIRQLLTQYGVPTVH